MLGSSALSQMQREEGAMHIISKDQVTQPFLAPLGEQIYELIGSQAAVGGSTRHSFAHVLVPPGKLSPEHYHRVSEESYYILKGRAHMVVDANEFILEPGQACLIKTGEVHQVFNRAAEDLEFLVVCAPPWTPDDTFAVEDVPQQPDVTQSPADVRMGSGPVVTNVDGPLPE
jgi:mannose-6-phosphate isomerase-like protein (cupin superfamily)